MKRFNGFIFSPLSLERTVERWLAASWRSLSTWVVQWPLSVTCVFNKSTLSLRMPMTPVCQYTAYRSKLHLIGQRRTSPKRPFWTLASRLFHIQQVVFSLGKVTSTVNFPNAAHFFTYSTVISKPLNRSQTKAKNHVRCNSEVWQSPQTSAGSTKLPANKLALLDLHKLGTWSGKANTTLIGVVRGDF